MEHRHPDVEMVKTTLFYYPDCAREEGNIKLGSIYFTMGWGRRFLEYIREPELDSCWYNNPNLKMGCLYPVLSDLHSYLHYLELSPRTNKKGTLMEYAETIVEQLTPNLRVTELVKA